MRRLTYLSALCALLVACGNGKTNNDTQAVDEDFTNDNTPAWTPEPGSQLNKLCDIPGIAWDIDTIYGVCVPDTLVLWATYEGRYLPTNVRASADTNELPTLTPSGLSGIKTDSVASFSNTSFTDAARLLDNLDISRDQMRHTADSILEKRVIEMVGIATDFFTSYGMPKYMTKGMANNWTRINNEAREQGVEPPNPINGYNMIEFEPGSVSVWVEDAQRGIVRVKAYCLDSFTLGHEGWGFWRMEMCREGQFFRVKGTPVMVRPTAADLE